MNEGDSLLKLDIACGKNKKPGFIGVDIWDGADIVVDLEKFPWPFEDNSVDEIFCSHYIEHTPDLISFANELFRILKVGATAEIIAPYYSSIRAWQDPTHLRAISENTFLYFNNEWRLINGLDHYPLTADFDYVCSHIISPEWMEKPEEERKFAIRHYINVVSDIHAILTKRIPCENDEVLLPHLASKCWENGAFREAVALCEQLVLRGTAGSDIYLMLAEYALTNNDYNKAIDSFRQALEGVDGDDDLFQVHVGLIRALNMSGLTTDAQIHLDGIRRSNPELADLIFEVVASALSNYDGHIIQTSESKHIGVILEVCSVCQLNCTHCAHAGLRKNDPNYHLSMEELDSFIDLTEKSGYTVDINIHGPGEPLLWKYLTEGIIRLRQSKSIKDIHINSNGLILPELTHILDLITNISVSLYPNTNTHIIDHPKVVYNSKSFFLNKEYPAETPCVCLCQGPMIYKNRVFPYCGPPLFDAVRRMGGGKDPMSFGVELAEYYAIGAGKSGQLPECAYCWANSNCRYIKEVHSLS